MVFPLLNSIALLRICPRVRVKIKDESPRVNLVFNIATATDLLTNMVSSRGCAAVAAVVFLLTAVSEAQNQNQELLTAHNTLRASLRASNMRQLVSILMQIAEL